MTDKGASLTVPTSTISFDKNTEVKVDVIVRFGKRVYLYYEEEPLGYIRHFEHSWYNENLESKLEELGVKILIGGEEEKVESYDCKEPDDPPLAVLVEKEVYPEKMENALLKADASVGQTMLKNNPYYSE